MIIKTVDCSEEESGESDMEWQDEPPNESTTPRQSATATSQSDIATTASQSSLLQDSLLEEELEISQPLVVNTVPVQDVSPNREYLEREETVMVEKFLSDGCGCNLANGGCSTMLIYSQLSGELQERMQ